MTSNFKKPLELFVKWYSKELNSGEENYPAACCLSTVGLDGYPNSRFVSLKEITSDSLIITGSLNSRKGKEIQYSSKVALSFWWTSTEKQVRVQGDTKLLTSEQADYYFEKRNQDSKIVSLTFNQGKEIDSLENLNKKFNEQKEKLADSELKRPDNWGGIHLQPRRVEFMEFEKSRLHKRTLYSYENNHWVVTNIQP